MKLKINYDLLDKIRVSENGTKLYKSEISSMINDPMIKFPLFWSFSTYVTGFILDKNLGMIMTIMYIGFYGGGALITNKVLKSIRKIRELEASTHLQELVNRLYNLEVKTTSELLKESKLNQTKYKIVYSDGVLKIPKLKQYKYIDVPLSNGYEETILQEHIFGDEDYEISVQSPIKKHQFKLAKASIGT